MSDFMISRAGASILLLALCLLSFSVSGGETIGGTIVVLDYELEDVMAPGSGGKAPGSEEVERRTETDCRITQIHLTTDSEYWWRV